MLNERGDAQLSFGTTLTQNGPMSEYVRAREVGTVSPSLLCFIGRKLLGSGYGDGRTAQKASAKISQPFSRSFRKFFNMRLFEA